MGRLLKRMRRDRLEQTLTLTCIVGCFSLLILNSSASDSFSELIEPVFAEYCVSCHGESGKVKGKVDLLQIEKLGDLSDNLDLVADLIDVIDFEEMPPEEEPQIDPERRQELLAALEAVLDQSLSEEKTYPPTPIRRMNRFLYANAVQDLFQLDRVIYSLPERIMREHRDYFQPETGVMAETVHVGSRPLGKSQMIEPRLAGVAPFPQDLRAEHGYDTQADHLSLSPLLMESFMKLSRSIVDSPDFVRKNVGIWDEFFSPPESEQSDAGLVRERIAVFLTRAFRGEPEAEVLDRYVAYASAGLEEGDDHAAVMKRVASAAIASPKFLYLYEGAQDGNEGTSRVSAGELASRLSFFLWGGLPDDELLQLAESGELLDGGVLSGQVGRMLEDRRIKRFCDSFPAQWLQLDRIISSVPDREAYPNFYFSKYKASMHMMLEPLLVFETVLIEDRPVMDLIDPDFTYRSDLLHTSLGYEQVARLDPKSGKMKKANLRPPTVIPFHRYPLEDRRYGGVITNAAVMTMTSGPERTQPITRGAWMASVIFNNPPKPPPADVPALGEKPPEGEEHLTLRERLSMHRERSDCRGCHEQIDPLGFALENYDPVGGWREEYENGREVDMSGTLFRKHEFTDVIGFKDAILAEKDRFARGLAGHLLSFALARRLGPADQPALDEIVDATQAGDYRFQAMIRAIVISEPFLSKTHLAKDSDYVASPH